MCTYIGYSDNIQSVRCTLTGSHTYFQLRFTHNTYIKSVPIYTTDNALTIQSKLSSMHGVGNVTVVFPRVLVDGINTACNANTNVTTGGFKIMFNYTLGIILYLFTYISSNKADICVYYILY